MNKEAASKVSDVYLRKHFTNLKVLLCSKDSLRKAIKIAADPVFGKAINAITIFVDGTTTPNWVGNPISIDKIPDDYDAHVFGLSALFTIVGDKLKRLHITRSPSKSPLHTKLPQGHGDPGTTSLETGDPLSLALVLLAAHQAQARITELSTCGWHFQAHRVSHYHRNQRSLDSITTETSSVLDTIETFDLDLWADDMEGETAVEFFDWIASAPHLNHLTRTSANAIQINKHFERVFCDETMHLWSLDRLHEREFRCLETFELRFPHLLYYEDFCVF